MSEQIPHKWVVLNIKTQHQHILPVAKDEQFQVVLAGWHGGYLDGDEWRRSSPIASIEEEDEKLIATTQSGTRYILYKHCRGFSSVTSNIYQQMLALASENSMEVSIEEMEEKNEP